MFSTKPNKSLQHRGKKTKKKKKEKKMRFVLSVKTVFMKTNNKSLGMNRVIVCVFEGMGEGGGGEEEKLLLGNQQKVYKRLKTLTPVIVFVRVFFQRNVDVTPHLVALRLPSSLGFESVGNRRRGSSPSSTTGPRASRHYSLRRAVELVS